jgi:exonuclease VII large subunit
MRVMPFDFDKHYQQQEQVATDKARAAAEVIQATNREKAVQNYNQAVDRLRMAIPKLLTLYEARPPVSFNRIEIERHAYVAWSLTPAGCLLTPRERNFWDVQNGYSLYLLSDGRTAFFHSPENRDSKFEMIWDPSQGREVSTFMGVQCIYEPERFHSFLLLEHTDPKRINSVGVGVSFTQQLLDEACKFAEYQISAPEREAKARLEAEEQRQKAAKQKAETEAKALADKKLREKAARIEAMAEQAKKHAAKVEKKRLYKRFGLGRKIINGLRYGLQGIALYWLVEISGFLIFLFILGPLLIGLPYMLLGQPAFVAQFLDAIHYPLGLVFIVIGLTFIWNFCRGFSIKNLRELAKFNL